MTEYEVLQLLKGRWEGGNKTKYLFTPISEGGGILHETPYDGDAKECHYTVQEKRGAFLLRLEYDEGRRVLELTLRVNSLLSVDLVKDGKALGLRKTV